MKIKTLKKYAGGMALLTLLGLLPASCIKDDTAAVKETTLTLTVATRAGETVGNNEMDANEQMKTLRVIVARHATKEIIYNEYRDEIDDNASQYVINFGELTIAESEDFDFYAIANENSLDLSGSGITLEEGTDIHLEALKNCIINRDYNVTEGDGPWQIPQTAFKTISVGAGKEKSATIQLEFVVAKVRVQFINETGNDQTISNVSLAGAEASQGYLFSGEEEGIRIPNGTTYSNLSIASSIEVLASADESNPAEACAYIYPSENVDFGSYVLSGVWNDQTHEVDDETITSGELVRSLNRGQLLDITIRLIGGEHQYTINALVNSWNEIEMDIPDFE